MGLDADKWLLRAEVQGKIEYRKGRWWVFFLFIEIKKPNRVLIREIADYPSQRLAEIAMVNMRNTINRSLLSTQKNKNNAFHFSDN